jgi:uncharacterized protein YaiE (UPF0345 family)
MKNKAFTLGAIGVCLGLLWKRLFTPQPEDIVNSLPTNQNKSYPKRTLDDITHIIVHHSATNSTSSGSNPIGYANFHILPESQGGRGWAGIAYHIVIQPDGSWYLTNYLDTISYHVGTLNPKAVGIVLSGNYDIEQPTPEMINSLKNALRWVQNQVGRKLKIDSHSDYSSKTCAGLNVRALLPDIIRQVGGKD